MSIRHRKHSALPDGADPSKVHPSDWNDEHVDENGDPIPARLVVDNGSDPPVSVLTLVAPGADVSVPGTATLAPSAVNAPEDVDVDLTQAIAVSGTGYGTTGFQVSADGNGRAKIVLQAMADEDARAVVTPRALAGGAAQAFSGSFAHSVDGDSDATSRAETTGFGRAVANTRAETTGDGSAESSTDAYAAAGGNAYANTSAFTGGVGEAAANTSAIALGSGAAFAITEARTDGNGAADIHRDVHSKGNGDANAQTDARADGSGDAFAGSYANSDSGRASVGMLATGAAGDAGMQADSDGVSARLGFNDKSPIVRPEVPAIPTAQDVVDALVALGLVTQAP